MKRALFAQFEKDNTGYRRLFVAKSDFSLYSLKAKIDLANHHPVPIPQEIVQGAYASEEAHDAALAQDEVFHADLYLIIYMIEPRDDLSSVDSSFEDPGQDPEGKILWGRYPLVNRGAAQTPDIFNDFSNNLAHFNFGVGQGIGVELQDRNGELGQLGELETVTLLGDCEWLDSTSASGTVDLTAVEVRLQSIELAVKSISDAIDSLIEGDPVLRPTPGDPVLRPIPEPSLPDLSTPEDGVIFQEGLISAYSLRRLPRYQGPLLRLRNSQGEEQDFFNLVKDEILSFCGNQSGHVVKWYDQGRNGYDVTPISTELPSVWDGIRFYFVGDKPSMLIPSHAGFRSDRAVGFSLFDPLSPFACFLVFSYREKAFFPLVSFGKTSPDEKRIILDLIAREESLPLQLPIPYFGFELDIEKRQLPGRSDWQNNSPVLNMFAAGSWNDSYIKDSIQHGFRRNGSSIFSYLRGHLFEDRPEEIQIHDGINPRVGWPAKGFDEAVLGSFDGLQSLYIGGGDGGNIQEILIYQKDRRGSDWDLIKSTLVSYFNPIID